MMSWNPEDEKAVLPTGTLTLTMIWSRNSRFPGADGLVNTADDALAPIEQIGFQRQIQILELNPVNADLRQILVTITYRVGAQQGTYTLRTFISSFS